ncbi:DUF481 domain-containing protein [Alteromonas aestuariivivens]|uniref:DUF481 domain-containing protein n=1 Tax=Alteromonas aestuariivivens TaxID=1938339 RepID=A0A3D8MEC4_9ALTE|nr:DUF481 domain-containing protein [Alteromonas aestuariivivens]RDV29092.1 DUF481 domain-containing protein [Alteromonas aestuariivivens]
MDKKILAFALSGLCFTTLAFAEGEEEMKPFSMEAGMGFNITTGNTETTSLNGSIVANHELEDWSNDYNISALYKEETVENADGEKEDRISAEKYFASAQANYKLTNPDHRLFGFASYEQDKQSSYDYQATLASGWNQKLWETETSKFEYSLGPGYAWSKTQDGEQQNGMIVRASAAFQWFVSETSKFTQTASTEVGRDNTKSLSESALTASINGSLSMKLGIKLSHNTHVESGKDKLDTETSVALVYNFF